MPTYEYECLERGHRFEEFQSITEPPLERCPECGGPARRRIGAGAGLLFKGSGFYQTDYRSESYRKGARAESDSGKAEEKKPKREENKPKREENKPKREENKPKVEEKKS